MTYFLLRTAVSKRGMFFRWREPFCLALLPSSFSHWIQNCCKRSAATPSINICTCTAFSTNFYTHPLWTCICMSTYCSFHWLCVLLKLFQLWILTVSHGYQCKADMCVHLSLYFWLELVCCVWQLDVAQLLSQPVVVINDKDNITSMLNVLRRFHLVLIAAAACADNVDRLLGLFIGRAVLQLHTSKGSGKGFYSIATCILQLQQFCASQKEPAYSLGRRRNLQSRTLACSHTAICSPGSPFNGLHPCNPLHYTDYYSFTDPGGMERWVGLIGWSVVDSLPTKWSPVIHRLVARKVLRPKTDILTIKPRCWCHVTVLLCKWEWTLNMQNLPTGDSSFILRR